MFYNKVLCGPISIYSPITDLPCQFTLNMWHLLRDFRILLRSGWDMRSSGILLSV